MKKALLVFVALVALVGPNVAFTFDGIGTSATKTRGCKGKIYSEDEGTTHDLIENKGSSLENRCLNEHKMRSIRGCHDVHQNKAT